MAKLNKMEIGAIANSICEEVNKQIKEYNNSLVDKTSYEKWLKTFSKSSEYSGLVTALSVVDSITKRYSISIYFGDKPETSARRIYEATNKSKKKELLPTSIVERDIIIGQAKDQDVDKLIKDLTKKYITSNK